MNHSTTCKFCKKSITVEVDDTYAGLGDPFKILPLAACNACTDNRVERRILEEKLCRACSLVSMLPLEEAKAREKMRGVLERLTKRYAKMIARWHRMDGELWDTAIVDQLMENPNQWGSTIGQLWKIFRQWSRTHTVALPYNDA